MSLRKAQIYLKTSISKVFKWLFKDKTEVSIFFTAFLIEMSLGLYLVYRWGGTFVLGRSFGGDLIAHLHISRTVIDNGNYGGPANLGAVWLPLPDLLRVPFVAFNVLYTTGLAGTIVNALMIAGTCILLYRFTGERLLGVTAITLFLMNIYTLVMGATAFQLPVGVFFATFSAYYFKNYWEKDSMTDFVKCSLAVILATLSRYECWLVMASIIFLFVVREIKNKRIYRLAYAHFPLWGVFAWLFWNLALFRDPFSWVYGGSVPGTLSGYSSSGYLGVFGRITTPPIEKILNYSMPAMFRLSGLLIAIIPLSTVLILKRRDTKKIGVTLVLLTLSSLIYFASWPGCERVLYAALPGVILAPLYMVRDSKSRTKIVVILLMFMTLGLAIPTQYSTFMDAVNTQPAVPHPYSEEMASLKNIIGEGSYILTSSAESSSPGRWLSVVFGISPSKIIDEYDYKLFTKVSKAPWLCSNWVVIDRIENPDDMKYKEDLEQRQLYYGAHFLYLYYYDPEWHDTFIGYYTLVLETDNYLLFERNE